MRVLITYGSKRGGTAGIAKMMCEGLGARGIDAELRPPSEAEHLVEYDAVIVGGALYFKRWPRDISRFMRQHRDELLRVPVWLFSSGPLDASAKTQDIPPTDQVHRFIAQIAAQGHMTFGGRLAPDAKGFLAKRMAKTRAGDFRDPEQVRRWTEHIADVLERRLYPDAEAEAVSYQPQMSP